MKSKTCTNKYPNTLKTKFDFELSLVVKYEQESSRTWKTCKISWDLLFKGHHTSEQPAYPQN